MTLSEYVEFERSTMDGMITGAAWGPGRVHRYGLLRRWNQLERMSHTVAFVGLNPSTATAQQNDPTVRRCIGFAQAWGFDAMVMLNVYGFRSTDPEGLTTAEDPVGPGHDAVLRYYSTQVSMIVCAWGSLRRAWRRAVRWDERIDRLLSAAVLGAAKEKLRCLRRNSDGEPGHPLYLPSDLRPIRFERS